MDGYSTLKVGFIQTIPELVPLFDGKQMTQEKKEPK